MCGYLKLKFRDVGQEARTRGQKGDGGKRNFVCDSSTVSHGTWLNSLSP